MRTPPGRSFLDEEDALPKLCLLFGSREGFSPVREPQVGTSVPPVDLFFQAGSQ
jgi:hypothetical protein